MFLSNITTAMSAGQTKSDSQSLNANFDTFLQLLTTQLKNQNPTDPLDANEFTKQLVQYSAVEQEIKSNKNLEALIQLQSVNAATAATSFIGKTITVESAQTGLANGQALWQYDASGSAAAATFTIRDDAGNTVYETTGELKHGKQLFTWDGRTSTGGTAPDGRYTLTVDARDSADDVIPVSISVAERIDAVDFTGNEPVLMAGERGVPLSEVRSVGGA